MSNINDIKKLYEMFAGLNIDILNIESPEGSVTLTFGNDKPFPQNTQTSMIESSSSNIEPTTTIVLEELSDITSPAVGIFERNNPKTNEYYVKLRDTIKIGQIIGHISVLGVRQDVIAHTSGKIMEILIEHEQPVEFGQPLIRLEVINEA